VVFVVTRKNTTRSRGSYGSWRRRERDPSFSAAHDCSPIASTLVVSVIQKSRANQRLTQALGRFIHLPACALHHTHQIRSGSQLSAQTQ